MRGIRDRQFAAITAALLLGLSWLGAMGTGEVAAAPAHAPTAVARDEASSPDRTMASLPSAGVSREVREPRTPDPQEHPATPSGSTQPVPSAPPRDHHLIMLLTDFGQKGYLLGSLKGAIYRSFPEAHIDSLTHDIAKFDIDEATQTLVLSTADYPAGTIFVVVVDPGIGGPRTPIALETENGHIYLAPDNGVLTQVAIRYQVRRIHRIENPAVVRAAPDRSTFLSRDVFGPAAAALAKGMDVATLGPELKNLNLLTSSPAQVRDGQIFGTISLIDGFGNIHTNITREQLEKIGVKQGESIDVAVGDRSFRVKLVKTYGDVRIGETLALVGNNEEVQLSINQGNLARRMELQKGESVVLKRP